MTPRPDIIKAGAILLNNRGAMLIVRPKGKDAWIFLGGKQDPGETLEECLIREVKEEIGAEVSDQPKFYSKSPIEPAHGKPDQTIQIHTYFIKIASPPRPSSEIKEIHWLTAADFTQSRFKLGSVLQNHLIPKLLQDGYLK